MEITKKEFININNKFDEYKIKEEKAFEYIEGKEKIIVSAPHSVRQIRNGNIKGKDSCTGTIAILLQKQLNCYCLYKTKNCNDDANYDIENNPYKDKIIDLVEKNNINFLLDIHGAKDGQGFDIDVGTANLKNLNGQNKYLKDFINIGEKYNLNITIDKVFKADTLHTVANTIARKTKIPCMQIEIAKKYRDIEQFNNIKIMLNFLGEYLRNILVGGQNE